MNSPAHRQAGTLYIVATPIGNLGDITQRAVDTLKSVDLICAEDTRHTKPLLDHYGITKPLQAMHQHNEQAIADDLVTKLQSGLNIALVSDAGTPLLSDPGYRVVCAAQDAQIRVSPLPGACAAIAALSSAGIATDRFAFEGFLSAKSSARQHQLTALLSELRSMIFYEASHRIVDTLEDMVAIYGPDRRACIAREVTKLFETITTSKLGELLAMTHADPNQRKGEFVIIVEGAPEDTSAVLLEGRRVYELLKPHLPPSAAARVAAEITGASRKDLYGSS